MSAAAFINAFTEIDVSRSSGAVSGRFRKGCAARVLVGSVLVTCRCLAVVRVLGPAGSGAPSGLFRRADFGHAKRHPRGPTVGVSL